MAETTWWLSFSDDSGHLGAVFVDGYPGDMLGARLSMILAGVKSPGGQCLGTEISPDQVPVEYREAWKKLPRLKVLSLSDLRVLGPLDDLVGNEK